MAGAWNFTIGFCRYARKGAVDESILALLAVGGREQVESAVESKWMFSGKETQIGRL